MCLPSCTALGTPRLGSPAYKEPAAARTKHWSRLAMSSSGVAGPIGRGLLNAAVLRQVRRGLAVRRRLAFYANIAVNLMRR
jgi:hypothetical protein